MRLQMFHGCNKVLVTYPGWVGTEFDVCNNYEISKIYISNALGSDIDIQAYLHELSWLWLAAYLVADFNIIYVLVIDRKVRVFGDADLFRSFIWFDQQQITHLTPNVIFCMCL